MRGDWREIAERAGYGLITADSISVVLAGGGSQMIKFRLYEAKSVLRATSIIAKPSVLSAVSGDSAYRYAWERNRLSDLIGFAVDGRRRLIGEAWIPLNGLTPHEFGLYLSELARVCDWHEFRLTGENIF